MEIESVKSPGKTFPSVTDSYISEKGVCDKKVPLDFKGIGEEQQGIIDMTFHYEDYVVNDNESSSNGIVIETEGDSNLNSKDNEACEDLEVQERKVEPPPPPVTVSGKFEETEDDFVNESLEIVKEMSDIFNTKLSLESLQMCLRLIEDGADYVALAEIIKNWRLKKAPKPVRKPGHFFDTLEDPTKKKKEWIW